MKPAEPDPKLRFMVYVLFLRGFRYCEIAKQLNAPSETVRQLVIELDREHRMKAKAVANE